MANFKFKRGPSSRLNTLPIEDGSIILTSDKQQLYVDIGSTRVSVGSEMATDADIVEVFNGGMATSTNAIDGTTTYNIKGSDNIEVTDF